MSCTAGRPGPAHGPGRGRAGGAGPVTSVGRRESVTVSAAAPGRLSRQLTEPDSAEVGPRVIATNATAGFECCIHCGGRRPGQGHRVSRAGRPPRPGSRLRGLSQSSITDSD